MNRLEYLLEQRWYCRTDKSGARGGSRTHKIFVLSEARIPFHHSGKTLSPHLTAYTPIRSVYRSVDFPFSLQSFDLS
jgi:hypothetical protein